MFIVIVSLATPTASPESSRARMQLVLPFSLLLFLPKPSAIVHVQAQAVFDDHRARAEERDIYPVSVPQFAVQLPGQSENTAREIAERYGLKFITKVGLNLSWSHTVLLAVVVDLLKCVCNMF